MSPRASKTPPKPWQGPPIRTGLPGLVLLASVAVVVACSGGPDARSGASTATLPAATPTAEAPPSPSPTPPPSHPPEQQAEDEDEDDDTLIVIEQKEAPPTVSLAEAARRAREQREEDSGSKIVITDENLAQYATGKLTVAAPKETAEGEGEAGESKDEASQERAHDEQYWRQGVRELRLKLRRAWEEAQTLEEQVAGLRLRFYAEDDPYVRDSEIKPAWDRALERQRQVEQEVKAYRRELEELLERGRRAGALPGWLREGIEYEPQLEDEAEAESEEALEGFGRHDPSEPDRMENPSRPPEVR